jgi:hypothetical protein
MNRFMRVQKKKIEIDKWLEGYNKKGDPGQEFVIEWIFKNADWFRKAWEKSLCVKCVSMEECGYKVREYCGTFKLNNND